MKNKYRDLTKREKEIIIFLLKNDFPGRNEIFKQIEYSKVRVINEYKDNWGSLEFKIKIDIKAPVVERIPVQASTVDSDGVPIQIFLHIVNGKIDELEIIKVDNKAIIKTIEAKDLKIDKVIHHL